MIRIIVTHAICVLGLTFAAQAGDSEARTFYGEISDSQCALNVHSLTKSHQEMYKSKSGAAGKTPASCALYCVDRMGGNFVLASKAHVYHLDNQGLARRFVGEKVKVQGVKDAKPDTLHVLNIEKD